ncbi:P-loop containing nucleoside triphosphate hydrolase protein [Phellopilus nigrolimitatus]|nr:P-loop containing nucleoside triphosphate hydrolase protein [Phellopilus nigrolimitatus]
MTNAPYAPLDNYGKSRYDYESHSVDAKIVVMGNTGVGKTSLLQRYTQNKFDPKNTTSTTGAFFVTKKVYVDGLKVRLQLWDTAGQERFRSMAPMYYRGANAALLLYDITNSATFDDVRGWLEELKKNCSSDLIIYIVGSKADLNRHRQVTSDRVRLSLTRWFPPPRPPSPPAPPPPQASTLSYIRPRFTSFTTSRSIPPSSLAPKALDDNALSRPSELRRSTTAFPRVTANWTFGNGQAATDGPLRRANSTNATGSPHRQKMLERDRERPPQPMTNSRFASHFGLQAGKGAYSDGLDGSSNSVPEEDEDDDGGDDREWGLEKGMSLFEVSAKDDYGVKNLFDALISAIIQRKDSIEQENELKKRDSVMLAPMMTPAWSAQADEEEKAQRNASRPWSCCQL